MVLTLQMKANPRHYGLQPNLQGEAFEAMVRDKLILSTASTLRAHDLVTPAPPRAHDLITPFSFPPPSSILPNTPQHRSLHCNGILGATG